MKIIGSLTSPYVRKVRIMLSEKKIDAELVLDNVWDASTTITDFNPLGKVPCLVMDDGGAMFDSRVIAEYIDTLSQLVSSSRQRVVNALLLKLGKRWLMV